MVSEAEHYGLQDLGQPGQCTTRQDLTADEQIRMKALECATRVYTGAPNGYKPSDVMACVRTFEDYLRDEPSA